MLLLRKSQGQTVRVLQQKLSELGYNAGPVDGVFGLRTEMAVIKFQTDNKLDIDGVVGNQTWNALSNESVQQKAILLESPPSYSRRFDVYGDFRIAAWKNQSLVRCDLSNLRSKLEHVYWGWLTPNDRAFIHNNWFGFICHELVVPKFQAAFKNVVEQGLSEQIKTFDGCYNPRMIRGGKEWSTHSWGNSIDLNATWNRFGQKNFEMSEELAKCFEEAGLVWGGRWTNFPDAMHFQYVTIR